MAARAAKPRATAPPGPRKAAPAKPAPAKPAARPAAYRSEALDDLARRIDAVTLGVAESQPIEALEAPSFRRILVACDGSPGSRHALAWAALLGQRLAARVTAVSVGPSQEAVRALRANALAWQAVGAAFDESEEEAVRVLREAGRFLADAGVAHTTELKRGAAAASIVALADSEGADLVVLGSHGHGFGDRLNLGSVGSSVKHHVACSVLVARAAPPPRRLLLATDGSQRSRIAVHAGLDLAKALGAPTALAHVLDAGGYGLGAVARRVRGRLSKVAHRDEASVRSGLPVRVASGPPAAELRRLAKSEKADLIVVGSRGLGGLRSLTLGSVSDRLTHRADQSVLVVKPRVL
jgi:nucleotide-binding universal stress UspA family protein